ncbi:MAG TPA: VOC family protein [Solirubrobacteraceae bacterium]
MRKHLISQLGHVELFTPRLEESRDFFHDILGLEESARSGDSIYMRCFGEFHHHSLKLTAGPVSERPEFGHFAYRAEGPEQLQTLVEIIDAEGLGEGWTDGDVGHGPAYRFRSPDKHPVEVFWEVEQWEAPEALKGPVHTRPQRYITRGAAARRLDHINITCNAVTPVREFFCDELGLQHAECARIDGTGEELISLTTSNNINHDLSITKHPKGWSGGISHTAFWYDTRDEIMRLADICRDYDVPMEWGPARHRGSELFFFYIREPGGHRIELCTGGYLVFAPDWKTVQYLASENQAVYWTGELPESMYGD